MKKSTLITLLVFLGVGMVTTVHANSINLKIRSLFNIKNSFCSIKTNEVLGMDNRKPAFSGRGGGISSTNSLLFLENGSNTISLEIGALNWFSKDNLTEKERSVFSKDAGCKLDLVNFDGETKKIITSIDVTINKNGVPVGKNDKGELITGKEILAENIQEGHIDSNFFNKFYFPKKMKLYEFSQQVNIHGVQEWGWVNSTPYNNKTEQLNKLRAAYTLMAEIINSKDRKKLKEYDHVALKAWSYTTGESEDEILLSQYPEEKLEQGKARIEPINWDDYEVRVMNKGRIVQLFNKSKPTFSPLTYYYIDEEGEKFLGYFAPMFSQINGEFVPVI